MTDRGDGGGKQWVRLSSKRGEAEVYHTDRDCRVLKGPVREPFEGELDRLDECSHCAETVEGQDQQDFSHFNSLREAAQND